MRHALISVSDKTGVAEFAAKLIELGFNIISTGGTLKTLQAAGIDCHGVSDITGFPECLDGRVKTLHPHIHAGLLALRDNKEHVSTLKELGISYIDVVAVNLYPFKKTVENPDVDFSQAVENIDIGGPTMLRSAAKNYKSVYSVCDCRDYDDVIQAIQGAGLSGGEERAQRLRLKLMYKVYQHTAYYDTLIAAYLQKHSGQEYTDVLTLGYEKAQDLRYGENPHQSAAFYREPFTDGGTIADARQLHGKELSFNNINDTNGALLLLKEFSGPCVVAVKHTNPCGVGVGDNIYDAYVRAYNADKVSVFGGIIAANRVIDERTAEQISKIFVEIVIAPGYDAAALEILTKKKNLRVMELPGIQKTLAPDYHDAKKVAGGLLLQNIDDMLYDNEKLTVVTKKQPTSEQLRQLEFAYKVVKHTKSNAIVLVNGDSTAGIGAGQTNRIWAAQQAIEHAGAMAAGSVMASDAFFPFADCVIEAAKAGITAIIQPGGSIRDDESIAECDKHGIAMVMCKMRHFKH